MITKKSRIFLSGHNGMVGSAIKRKLIERNNGSLKLLIGYRQDQQSISNNIGAAQKILKRKGLKFLVK